MKFVHKVCSPIDAIENFSSAISEGRNYNDNMWLAGACEGLAIAILMAMQTKAFIEESLSKEIKTIVATGLTQEAAIIKIAEDKCTEALQYYSKNIAFAGLEVECLFRLARMYEESLTVLDKEQKVLLFYFSLFIFSI
jgi:hypothetical protein